MKKILLILVYFITCSFQDTSYTFTSADGMFQIETPCKMENLNDFDAEIFNCIQNADTKNGAHMLTISIYKKPMKIIAENQEIALSKEIEKYLAKELIKYEEKLNQKKNEIYCSETFRASSTILEGLHYVRCMLINENFIVLSVYIPKGTIESTIYQAYFDSFKISDIEAIKLKKEKYLKMHNQRRERIRK